LVASPGQQQRRDEQLGTGTATVDRRPVVVLSANNCWNLVNFRGALLPALQQAGYRVVAFAPLDSQAEELRRRGVEIEPIPIARSGMNPLTDARLLVRYVRALRTLRPAAYCGFTIKPNVYGAIAARLAGVPAINNVTGLATPYLSQGLVWALAERLYRFAFKRSHTVFFHNREDLEIMVARKVIRPEQGRVIPGSGVNLEHFRPDEHGAAVTEGRPCFLFIGRAIVHKGIREYVEAARRLRRRMPEARFQLLGNPDRHNPTSVSNAEFNSWIAEGVIEHLGEHGDVRPFIRAATAVVLPTYREGMSRALLEGAAMGKPLIGSDVAGSRELVEEGITGALCKPRDASSLADAMERIARLPAERLAEMGRTARRKIEREFSEELVVEAYLRALDEAVER
jgi:glycosyltransferase involved in cell wall biosynthesis